MKIVGKHRNLNRTWVQCLVVTAVTILAIAGYWAYLEVTIAQQKRVVDKLSQTAAARIAEIDAKKKQTVYVSLAGAETIRALVDDYENSSSIWTLVNKDRALSIDYIPPELITLKLATRTNSTPDEKRLRQTIEAPLTEMFAAAAKDGHMLMVGSGYRSAVTQESLFNTYVARVGYDEANRYSAHPGHSEHQTGLALDISTVSQQCYLAECFIGTADGQWLADNAYKFGFHLRYPKGKEATTGYNFEPWHYRYVGIDLATALHKSNLTLDEAWPQLESASQTLKTNRAI
jgi:LAS superfamily LD-carboxypeptidase LdcB